MKVVVALLLLFGLAYADDKGLAKFYGQIVVTRDAPPSTAGEMPKFLGENVAKDGHYERLGGAPWDMNLIGVLSKDPGGGNATLVFLEGDKSMQEVEVSVKGRLVIAHVQATKAAGFEPNKPYTLRIKRGDAVLAKAELTLRN